MFPSFIISKEVISFPTGGSFIIRMDPTPPPSPPPSPVPPPPSPVPPPPAAAPP